MKDLRRVQDGFSLPVEYQVMCSDTKEKGKVPGAGTKKRKQTKSVSIASFIYVKRVKVLKQSLQTVPGRCS